MKGTFCSFVDLIHSDILSKGRDFGIGVWGFGGLSFFKIFFRVAPSSNQILGLWNGERKKK